MSKGRSVVIRALLRGLLCAAGVELLGMLALAAAIIFLKLPESWLSGLNQALKLAAVLAGVGAAVGRGGEKGLVTGAVTAALFMIAGYASCCALGGIPFSWGTMLAEILLGSLAGAVFGAVLANMKPGERKKKRTRGFSMPLRSKTAS